MIRSIKEEPRGSFFISTADTGFTLMELAMVLAILGILAAVAIPRFVRSPFDDSRLYQETLTALRYAQRLAVTEQRTVCIIFTSNTQLDIKHDPNYGGSNCATPSDVPAPGSTSGASTYRVVRSGSAVYSGASNFSFDLQGRPSASITLTIGSRQIKVEPETGYVYEP